MLKSFFFFFFHLELYFYIHNILQKLTKHLNPKPKVQLKSIFLLICFGTKKTKTTNSSIWLQNSSMQKIKNLSVGSLTSSFFFLAGVFQHTCAVFLLCLNWTIMFAHVHRPPSNGERAEQNTQLWTLGHILHRQWNHHAVAPWACRKCVKLHFHPSFTFRPYAKWYVPTNAERVLSSLPLPINPTFLGSKNSKLQDQKFLTSLVWLLQNILITKHYFVFFLCFFFATPLLGTTWMNWTQTDLSADQWLLLNPKGRLKK